MTMHTYFTDTCSFSFSFFFFFFSDEREKRRLERRERELFVRRKKMEGRRREEFVSGWKGGSIILQRLRRLREKVTHFVSRAIWINILELGLRYFNISIFLSIELVKKSFNEYNSLGNELWRMKY